MEYLQGFDEWKTTSPEEPDPAAHCDQCGSPLYEGDFLYTVNGERLCEECVNDGFRRML